MEFLRLACKYLLCAALWVFRIFPVRNNRLFFINDLSFTYGDSPKAICEYLLDAAPGKYEIIFPLRDGAPSPGRGIVTVAPKSLRYFYFALTSKVLVTNAGGISYLPVRKSQMTINTWHGGGAYKKVGLSAFYSPAYRLENRLNAKKLTYMLASTRLAAEEYHKAMLIGREKFLPTGLPRNDIFFRDTAPVRSKVFAACGLEPDKRLALYCPTYRSGEDALSDFYEPKRVKLDADRLLDALRRRFGGQWVLAERAHPRLRETAVTGGPETVNLSRYPDMQELLCAADAVISDYSSLIWDYSLTGKPCFIYADDIVEYQRRRGFYCPIERWPYPIATDLEALLDNIERFDQQAYAEKVRLHYEELGSFERGTASEAVFRLIDGFCDPQGAEERKV